MSRGSLNRRRVLKITAVVGFGQPRRSRFVPDAPGGSADGRLAGENGCGGENHRSHLFNGQIRARQYAGTCRCGGEQSCWTWTKGSPTFLGQVQAAELVRSGTPWTGRLLRAHFWSSLITPLALFRPFPESCFVPAPISTRFLRSRLGPLIPRNWPPVSPRLTGHCHAVLRQRRMAAKHRESPDVRHGEGIAMQKRLHERAWVGSRLGAYRKCRLKVQR
jgi:hypothetical protein